MKKHEDSSNTDHIYAQWQRERPDISTQGAQILARARRLTLLVRPEIEAGEYRRERTRRSVGVGFTRP